MNTQCRSFSSIPTLCLRSYFCECVGKPQRNCCSFPERTIPSFKTLFLPNFSYLRDSPIFFAYFQVITIYSVISYIMDLLVDTFGI
jgi:hypothetical protein